MLLKIYKQIHSKNLTKKTKMAFFKLLMHLLQFLPTSKNLAEIFSLAYDDEDTLVKNLKLYLKPKKISIMNFSSKNG